jgi:hypothetical protein
MRFHNVIVHLALILAVTFIIACQPTPAPQDTPVPEEPTQVADTPDTATPETPEQPTEPVDSTSITPDEEGTTVVVDESGETVVVTNSPDGGATTYDPNTGTTVTVNAEIPEEWPEDIPLMDGFELIQAISGDDTTYGETYTLILGGNAPFEEIEDFYGSLEGWDKTVTGGGSPDGSEGIMMIFNRESELLTISATKPEETVPYDVVINLQYVKQ